MAPHSLIEVDRLVLAVSTLPGHPDLSLLQAASRAGAIAVLNLEGVPAQIAADSLSALAHGGFGQLAVRVDADSRPDLWSAEIADALGLIIVAAGVSAADFLPFKSPSRRLFAECTSLAEARAAMAHGVDGLIAKGHESAGRVGEETTFVLVQRLLAETRLPIWAQGGIGQHTIGACAVAGCAGVVLDAQLALARESSLPDHVKTAVERMGGDETLVLGAELDDRYRVFTRPDHKTIEHLRRREAELATDEGDVVNADSSGEPGARERWREAIRSRINWGRHAGALWPLGQDAAFAAPLARRFRSVAGMLHGLRQALDDHCATAAELGALEPGAPLAASHGTRYPVLQGPMTRVSDTAGFAGAVADAGGLPFLACALLRAPQLRTLLRETKALLGARPWGVGILGFVPLELREEQLAVISEFAPPVALIAGGRPDQAAALERLGTATYLHVPAPSLLRVFLDDGARRFVFEGRECGGHVGPRTSFVLWESVVTELVAAIARGVPAGDLHVVFAGGIHDARSAAMVATIAAPLARLGARIGILMGTAYLFTKEAVATGAIVEGFQQEAVRCTSTVLLESGPGHATRCAATPFFSTFQEARRRMIKEGRSGDEVRLALEAMNLGRLRIASKGITRESESDRAPATSQSERSPYVTVSPEDQRREGMYMIGQIAALRDRVCRVADLHETVSTGATALLRDTAERHARRSVETATQPAAALSASLAIVGIGCHLPKAPDVRTLWNKLLQKVDAIGEIPPGRFDSSRYYDPDRHAPDKIYSKWGGFLEEIPFDPIKHGIVPAAVPSIDPFQLLTLEVVNQALKDAGYADREFNRERTSVVLGASGGAGDLGFRYGIRAGLPMYFDHVPEETLGRLPQWTEDSFAGVLLNVAAGRVANRLNLGGVNFTVDAACASSLAAVYIAARELESGASDMVIVGGIDTVNSPFGYLCFSSAQALSPTGRCRTFDEAADGIAISEGIVMLVLKRLADAERAGDRIYAVVRAVAGSSDGKGKGLTAPRPEGQMRVLERAYAVAGFSPATVGLVEAHGTGTVAGDSAEVSALSRVYGEAGTAPGSVALGSIKSMIGHTKSAAGVSGLMKVALALHHKILPPTLHVTNPNARLRQEGTPFFVNTEPQPWIAPTTGDPRRAAVSSFGFGGTNFHVVIEEYNRDVPGALPDSSPVEYWPAELFLWSSATPQRLLADLQALDDALQRAPGTPLRNLAAAVCRAAGPSPGNPFRLAIVTKSVEELRGQIAAARSALEAGRTTFEQPERGVYLAEAHEPAGKVAWLFPGQGSQYPNMHRDLAVYFPDLRHALEIADRVTAGGYPRRLSHYVLPGPSFSDEQTERQQRELTDTVVAQPALGAVEMGLCRILERLGIRPDMTAGHSYGEYSALAAAGALSIEDLFSVSESRGRLIKAAAGSADAGTMAAVGASPEVIARTLGTLSNVWIANVNSPRQTVLAGRTAAVEAAIASLSSAGIQARRLPVACAFHTPLVEAAERGMASVLERTPLVPPRVPVFSNALAAPYPANADEIRRLLSSHITSTVHFAGEIEAMYAEGARIFVEIGPRTVLSNLVRETLSPVDPLILSMDAPGKSGVIQLLHVLARLAAAGVAIDHEYLWRGRGITPIQIAKLQPAPGPAPHVWMVNGGRARRLSAPPPVEPQLEISEPALDAPSPGATTVDPIDHVSEEEPMPEMPNAQYPTAVDSPDVMRQFQQLMSQFLQTQALVMTTYLQADGQPMAAMPQPVAAMPQPMAAMPQPMAAMPQPIAAPPPLAMAPPAPAPRSVAAAPPAPVDASVVRAPAAGNGNGNGNGHARIVTPVVMPPSAKAEPGISSAAVLAQLLQIVGERTGYPEDMLDPDANIEADLGIDSIKRMEILAAFQQLHAGTARGAFQGAMEKLTALKTLRETAAALSGVLAGQAEVVA